MSAEVSSHLAELGLNLVRVDNSSKISAGHHVSAKRPSRLDLGGGGVRPEDLVEGLESILSEDSESSEVTAWSELEEIDSVDVADLNSWQVSGSSLDHWALVSVDDQRSLTEGESGVLHFSNTSSCSLGLSDSGEVIHGTKVLEVAEESASAASVEAVDNEREFWHSVDSVATSLDERSTGACGKGGGNGISLLLGVDLSLPLSPDLEWGKHATLSAHVSESTLA